MRPQIVKILTLILFAFNSISLLAQERSGPPPPAGNRRPPQGSIDDSIIVLIVVGLLYGAYIVYKKHQLKDSLQ